MYLGDATNIESHLNNDWSVMLKNLKLRQDHHYQLLQYNRKIITKQRSEDNQLFVNDQILNHQQEINKITNMNNLMKEEEKEIVEKYQGVTVHFEEIIKLMGRVGARVLETCQYSIDKCKALDQELSDKHYRMKTTIVKFLNQKDKINLEEITNLVIVYSESKLMNQVDKLLKLVKVLKSGQYQKLQEAYLPQIKKHISIQKRKEVSIEKAKVSSVGKEQKISSQKSQVKNQEKARKQKQKLATKMVTGLYSTMQLSKQQFIDDMCGGQKQKATRLYNQIFSRNKFNYQQIIAFETKKDQFQQKVKLFKEMMQRQSQKIAEVLIRKPNPKQIYETSQNYANTKSQLTENRQEVNEVLIEQCTQKKLSSSRYRIHSPKTKKDFRQTQNMFTSALQNTQQNFTHFKFDASGHQIYARTNRNRLPHIGGQMIRGTSLDQRIQVNKSMQMRQQITLKKAINKQMQIDNVEQLAAKQQKPKQLKTGREERHPIQRTRVQMKNIQVGVQGVMKRQEVAIHQNNPKQRKKIEPNPMQYTFYVRRSSNKFYEPKHNIIF